MTDTKTNGKTYSIFNRKVKGYTENNFKKELTDHEFKATKKAILRFFRAMIIQDRTERHFINTMSSLENLFGLPYTSSGSYAGFWNTNSEVFIFDDSTFTIQGFALTNDLQVICLTTDFDENEFNFVIGQLN